MSPTQDGASALILHKNKILLFLRDGIPTIPYPNCWHLPGGHIEEGETPLMAVKRELSEEVSHIPSNLKYIKKITHAGGTAFIFISVVDDLEAKKFKLGPGEGQEIKFFTLEEISHLKLTPVLEFHLAKLKEKIQKTDKKTPRTSLFATISSLF